MSKKPAAKGKGGKNEEVKAIDPAEYVRKPVDIAELDKVPPMSEPVTAKAVNIESLFPAFSISSENWSEAPEGETISYPKSQPIVGIKSIKVILGLEAEVEEVENVGKKGKKKETKKAPPKNVAPLVFEEHATDENGKNLPSMYINANSAGKDDEFNGFDIPREFLRRWTDDQAILLGEQNVLKVAAQEETEADEMNVVGTAARDAYAAALAIRDVEKEPRAGQEYDSLMCYVFRFIRQFAPNVVSNQTGESSRKPSKDTANSLEPMKYLWRAIYPQLGNGKPFYNPMGKYCVRLFLAGKWRKVTVNDTLPVHPDGTPMVANSSNPLEMWPLILSKAVYAAYSACRYETLVPSMGYFPVQDHLLDDTYACNSASSFVSFAIHVLTGWLPNAPLSLHHLVLNVPHTVADGDTENILRKPAATDDLQRMHTTLSSQNIHAAVEQQDNRMRNLFLTISQGGARNVARSDIPGINPASVAVDDSGRDFSVLKTKSQLRQEYIDRIANRNILISAINERERKINIIQSNVAERPFGEAYFIVVPDMQHKKTKREELKLYPVLAVSLPTVSMLADAPREEILVLTSWSRKIEEPNAGEPSISDNIPGMDPLLPIPASSTIEQTWLDLKSLVKRHAYIVSVDTRTDTMCRSQLGWHWNHLPEEVVPKGSKKKEVVPDKPVEVLSESPGVLPFMLLKLDTKALNSKYKKREAAALAALPAPEHQEAHPEGEEGASLAESSVAADHSMTSGADAGSVVLDTESLISCESVDEESFINLSVFIHTDMLLPPSTSSPDAAGDNSYLASQEADGSRPATTDVHHSVHPSYSRAATVILQEADCSAIATPLLLRVELNERQTLPYTRVMFHLPVTHLQKKKQFLFWVRLFGTASTFIECTCPLPIEFGEGEKIWKDSGRQVFNPHEHQQVTATRENCEKLLFRKSIQLSKPKADSEEDDVAMVSLFVSNKDIANTISFVITDDTTENSYVLPRLQGNYISLSHDTSTTITARCFHSHKAIPAFQWKLLVLTDNCPVQMSQNNSSSVEHAKKPLPRYVGTFRPNNRLLLFRDVLTVEKDSFPMAFHIAMKTMHPSPKPDLQDEAPPVPESDAVSSHLLTTNENLVLQNLNFIVRIYRKVDQVLISESKAQGIMQLYNIRIDELMRKPASVCASNGNMVEMIVEGLLDESAMHISPSWRSKLPYVFSPFLCPHSPIAVAPVVEKGKGGNAMQQQLHPPSPTKPITIGDGTCPPHPSAPIFMWQLDILGGAVSTCSHDTHDLEKFYATKAKWETDAASNTLETGVTRLEKAQAALAYYEQQQARKYGLKEEVVEEDKAVKHAKGGSDHVFDPLVTHMATALHKTPEQIEEREELIASAPKCEAYTETELSAHILDMVSNSDSSRVTTSLTTSIPQVFMKTENLSANKEARDNERDRVNEQSVKLRMAIDQLGESIKGATKERIQHLIDTAKGHVKENKKTWLQREHYKATIANQNASLKYILQRTSSAIVQVAEEAAAAEDALLSGGKGKKGKKK